MSILIYSITNSTGILLSQPVITILKWQKMLVTYVDSVLKAKKTPKPQVCFLVQFCLFVSDPLQHYVSIHVGPFFGESQPQHMPEDVAFRIFQNIVHGQRVSKLLIYKSKTKNLFLV